MHKTKRVDFIKAILTLGQYDEAQRDDWNNRPECRQDDYYRRFVYIAGHKTVSRILKMHHSGKRTNAAMELTGADYTADDWVVLRDTNKCKRCKTPRVTRRDKKHTCPYKMEMIEPPNHLEICNCCDKCTKICKGDIK